MRAPVLLVATAERKKGDNLFNPFLNALLSRGDIEKMLQAFLQQSAKLRGPGEIFYSVNANFFFFSPPPLTHKPHLCPTFQLPCAFLYSAGWYCSGELLKKESWRLAYPIELLMFPLLHFLSSVFEGGWKFKKRLNRITCFIFFLSARFRQSSKLVKNRKTSRCCRLAITLTVLAPRSGICDYVTSPHFMSSHLISCARESAHVVLPPPTQTEVFTKVNEVKTFY